MIPSQFKEQKPINHDARDCNCNFFASLNLNIMKNENDIQKPSKFSYCISHSSLFQYIRHNKYV